MVMSENRMRAQTTNVIENTFDGSNCPGHDEMAQMQAGQYILHARDGKINRVEAEKVTLPRDPRGHAQGMMLAKTQEETLYIRSQSLLHKSLDGGRTWETKPFQPPTCDGDWMEVLPDGTFMCISLAQSLDPDFDPDNGLKAPAGVWISKDESLTWEKISEFAIDLTGTPHEGFRERYANTGLTCLPDGGLLYSVDPRNEIIEKIDNVDVAIAGSTAKYFYRSDDGGMTWQGPGEPVLWTSEGGITALPSGRLFASLRHQRPLLPEDPAELRKVSEEIKTWPWKHVFITESDDGGWTWGELRQLTPLHGQCFGYPLALSDGTVIVIHDNRYGPNPHFGQARVSFDEGQTWGDETYAMYYGCPVSGYNRSVVLTDDTIVTLCGTCERPEAEFEFQAMIGHTDFTVIRWKPVPKA